LIFDSRDKPAFVNLSAVAKAKAEATADKPAFAKATADKKNPPDESGGL
jgi:hypothetical protein